MTVEDLELDIAQALASAFEEKGDDVTVGDLTDAVLDILLGNGLLEVELINEHDIMEGLYCE